MKTTQQLSANEWINKIQYNQTMAYYLAMKNWSIDVVYNMSESWKHYAKQKKPVPEECALYDSIYIKCQEQTNP